MCPLFIGAYDCRKIRRHPELRGAALALCGMLLAGLNLAVSVALPERATKLYGLQSAKKFSNFFVIQSLMVRHPGWGNAFRPIVATRLQYAPLLAL